MSKTAARHISRCRACGNTRIEKFLSLGSCPPSNSFIRKENLGRESSYPLETFFCHDCALVQLGVVVPREEMFLDYVYVSSTSRTLSAHLAGLAETIVRRFGLSDGALAVDIGSNDGALLSGYLKFDVRPLGIEPSNVAEVARSRGIETYSEFFSETLAKRISDEKGPAKAITMTNVFAHVDDWDDLLRGVRTLLDDDGVFVIEVPYLVNLLDDMLFDTIYHEHLNYVSVTPLVPLFARYGMKIIDIVRMDFGPSGPIIRVFTRKDALGLEASPSVDSLLDLERRMKLDTIEPFFAFARRVEAVKDGLLDTLTTLKKQGKSIVGYGAPAKGNTILNYCGIGPELLDYLTEKNPRKVGLLSPGMHIPVEDETRITADMPDYALLLAWNLLKEFMEHSEYIRKGGRFIIPLPKPHIVE